MSESTTDALREEVKNLRAQMESFLKSAETKKQELTGDALHKMAKELEYYRQKAADGAVYLRDAGEAGLDTVGEQVRRNPLMSLLLAFGAGCLVALLFRGLR